MTRRRLAQIIIPLLAVVVALAALYAYTAYQVSRAETVSPPEGQFVDIGSERLHYIRVGSGSPVVLIHGLGGMLQDFAPVIDSLALNHEIIAFDRPGYGYSEYPEKDRLSISYHARILHDALQALGINRPIVVGHSLGGGIALRYALEYPQDLSGLVLLAPAAYPVPREAELLGAAGRTPVLGSVFYATLATPISRIAAPYTVKHAFAPDTVPTDYLQQRLILTSRPTQIRASAYDLSAMNEGLGQQSPRYHELSVPVTILTGDGDRLLDFRSQAVRLHEAVPGSRLSVLSGAGHMLPYSRPGDVIAAIRAAIGY